jgi:cell division protein FtsI/penicillin-binding protein 2
MNQKVFKRRIYISALVLIIVSFFLISKLIRLHFSGKIIVEAGRAPEIKRGVIKDRNGDILAMSIERDSVYANPEEIKNPRELADVLSQIIDVPRDRILRRLLRKKKFIWLSRKVNPATAARIKKLGVRGVYLKKEYKRVYPNKKLASNIIGFTGIDNSGLEGIESRYNRILTGFYDTSKSDLNFHALYGNNIVLTIDRFIQHVAESEIEDAVTEYRAKQGAVIITEVKTGRILAMAKYPNFDPNRYSGYSPFKRRNFSIIDFFEPGSTLKVLSVAAVLESSPETAKREFVCRGKIELFDTTINCTGVHGKVNLKKSLRHSCNVGIIEAMKRVKKEKLYELLARFDFGKSLGSGLPGESRGIFRPIEKWSGLSKYSIAIGHEISATSLQVAAAIGAVANGGIYMKPKIIKFIEESSGKKIREYAPVAKGRVLGRRHAAELMLMMKDVVENGSGKRAASDLYEFAGKTGTSRKYSLKGGEYSDRVISSFIGVGPFNDPEVCIYVIIDEPEGKQYGGKIAAPVFRKIGERILPQMGVKRKVVAAGSLKKRRDRTIKLKGNRMPDFRGMKLSPALRALSAIQYKFGAEYRFKGSGTVYAQSPEPGDTLKRGSKIILYMREKER